MDTICVLLQPWVNLYQSILTALWTPFTWLGITVPHAADFLNLFLPCQLQ